VEHAIFTELNAAEIHRPRYMNLLGNICAGNQCGFHNSGNTLILFLLHLILHLERLFRMLDLFFEERFPV
jgi:hypothetical protein